jgi:hypothetical protein
MSSLFLVARVLGELAHLAPQLREFGPFATRESFSFTAVDPLLAHPVAKGLVVDAERPRDVNRSAFLVNWPDPRELSH